MSAEHSRAPLARQHFPAAGASLGRVAEEAARDFILGHLNVELAILFDQLPGVRMSDAANKAVERAKKEIFAPDWKKVFEREAIAENIRMITSV
jgi:D-apionate oxidoisomerase